MEDLHSCPRVHLVVASRINSISEMPAVQLPPLPIRSAEQLLMECSGKAAEAWQPGEAEKLAAACRNNALLLKIIGAMLARKRCNMKVCSGKFNY